MNGMEAAVLDACAIALVILAGLLVYGLLWRIPQLGESWAQRNERTQEATRRSNELRRQSDQRNMDRYEIAGKDNDTMREQLVAVMGRCLDLEARLRERVAEPENPDNHRRSA